MTERVIGIDVGGTKTAIGVIRIADGGIETSEVIASPDTTQDHGAFLDHLVKRSAALAEKHDVNAIGLSICELVDLAGIITSGHRIRWQGLDAQRRFAAIRPSVAEADVRAAALAEARLGAGRNFSSFLYVNIGTGISSAFVHEGRVHAGARGNALALGSSPAGLDCPHCGDAASYVPEDVAGGEGLLRAGGSANLSITSAGDLFALADVGNPVAARLADRAAAALGVSIGLAVNILDPEAVVLGGGLILAAPSYFRRTEASIRAHIWSDATRGLRIGRAGLGGHSAMIGAALKAAERLQAISSPKVR